MPDPDASPTSAAPSAPDVPLRRAGPGDLDALIALEAACFEPERRSSRAVLRRSLQSPRQEVWLIDADEEAVDVGGRGVRVPAAMLVVWRHPRTTRVYSLAVHADRRGRGLGERLLRYAEAESVWAGAERVVLEVDARRPRLVTWYEAQGYRRVAVLPDYYGSDRPAVRMEKRLAPRAAPVSRRHAGGAGTATGAGPSAPASTGRSSTRLR